MRQDYAIGLKIMLIDSILFFHVFIFHFPQLVEFKSLLKMPSISLSNSDIEFIIAPGWCLGQIRSREQLYSR